MVAGGIWGIYHIKNIDKEYATTVAKIEKIQRQTERRNRKTYIYYDVLVSYTVNGKVHTAHSNSYSSSMQVGDSIQLRYNPQQVTEIRSIEIEHSIFVVMTFAGLIVLISTLFIPRMFRKMKIID